MLPKKANNNKKTEIMAHDSFGNTDPQRGAQDSDALHGENDQLKGLGKLSNALSNDENGFSNKEGFNTDEGHKSLAGSGGSQTSDMMSLDNAHNPETENEQLNKRDSSLRNEQDLKDSPGRNSR